MGLIHKSQTAINETKKVFQNYKQRKQGKSPLKNKFYIPGFPKCGSTSLEKYLLDKKFDVPTTARSLILSIFPLKSSIFPPFHHYLRIIRII